MFVNLYTETHYSMSGSNITIENLVKKAISSGYSSLAITDDRMYGAIKFYKECKKNNLKPIIGLRLFVEGLAPETKNQLFVYAKNNNGYVNVMKLASLSSIHHVVSFSDFKKLVKDVIVIVDTDRSDFLHYFRNNKLNELNELYSNLSCVTDLFFATSILEELNDKFESLGKLVLIDEVKYLHQEDKEVYDILSKIFNKNNDVLLGDQKDYHFKSNDEITTMYPMMESAIKRTKVIADMIDVDIDFSKILLPSYPHNKGGTSKEYLHALAFKGLEKRLKGQKVDKKRYIDRLEYELGVIDDMGYNDYFLIVWDFVKYSRSKDYLVGPGRGSAAASLVSYCLGITSVDSIKYDLVFERFLNPERITMPDIDMDLPDDKRDDIIKYVRDFYGVNKVASICTFGTFLSKSALRDTARVLEVHGVLLDEIIKESNKFETIQQMMDESSAIQHIMNQDSKAGKLLSISSKIEGLQRHVSTHAAGIIVTSSDLTDYTAVQPGLLDMMQTQYEAKDLEDLGLLKIDFLGLRNLSSIHKIVALINQNEKRHIDIYKVGIKKHCPD